MDHNSPPGDVAKKTLTRLAREQQAPVPVNYCRTYRDIRGGNEPWQEYCGYTRLLQESLRDLLAPWRAPEVAVDSEVSSLVAELDHDVAAAVQDADLQRVRNEATQAAQRMRQHLLSGAEARSELLSLTQLLVEHIGALADQDKLQIVQIGELGDIVDGAPSVAALRRARRLVGELAQRQTEAGAALREAQDALKAVIAELVQHAASMVDDTAGFEQRVGTLTERVQAANDPASIRGVVSELGGFVHEMGETLRSSHAEMSSAQTRLIRAEQQIVDLRQSLAETSEKARRDRLTGALNRTGLDDIWQREVQNAAAGGLALSIGILDVDNFKRLNDTLGHKVGDEALVHLSTVIRNALHGTDTMARYGGEEFVILLPDTDAEGGEAVMKRLQRELTKHFFMHDSNRLLITFSAGVTQVRLGSDTLIAAIERADTALYRAKREGKNRVVIG